MPRSLSLAVLVVLAFAVAPTGASAQEQGPVIGVIAEGLVSTQPNPNGDRRTFFPLRMRCQKKDGQLSSFANCSSDRIYPEATVTYSVSAATRAKYRLPSVTVARQQFTGEETTNTKVKASLAMSRALARIKGGSTITIKEKVALTFPFVETLTDSVTIRISNSGYPLRQAWSVRTSNIDDGTMPSGGGKG